ncbi:MAG: isochorismate synthase MenF [Actinomycetales bacterium]
MSTRADADRGSAVAALPGLVVRSVPLADPPRLLETLPHPGALAWVRHGDGLVGWGEALRIDTAGADRFAEAGAHWRRVVAAADVRDEVRARGSGLVAFGSFAFADDSPSGGSLVVPSTVVGRHGDQGWLTTIGVADAGNARPADGDPLPRRDPRGVRLTEGALSSDAWREAVAATVRRIAAGEADKVVLARDLVARSPEPLDDRVLLSRLAQRYPTTWTFALDGLVGATPELLARTEGGRVASRVLAGTIRRSGDHAADLALAASLARSGKDLAEHLYAVRSVAEALRPLCSDLDVPERPYVLHLANVMHLATDVTGVLRGAATSLGIAAALHPSAAVGGTPTKVAGQLIADTEGMDRGRYAGPVGWLDATGDGEWGIALRCGQLSPDRHEMRLLAGCGIVAGSDPDAELAESTAKLVPIRQALSG